MPYDYNSAAYQVFRGINQADKTVDKDASTVIIDAADDFQEDNKTNLTIALEGLLKKLDLDGDIKTISAEEYA